MQSDSTRTLRRRSSTLSALSCLDPPSPPLLASDVLLGSSSSGEIPIICSFGLRLTIPTVHLPPQAACELEPQEPIESPEDYVPPQLTAQCSTTNSCKTLASIGTQAFGAGPTETDDEGLVRRTSQASTFSTWSRLREQTQLSPITSLDAIRGYSISDGIHIVSPVEEIGADNPMDRGLVPLACSATASNDSESAASMTSPPVISRDFAIDPAKENPSFQAVLARQAHDACQAIRQHLSDNGSESASESASDGRSFSSLSSPTFAPPTPNLSGESTDPSPVSSIYVEQTSKRPAPKPLVKQASRTSSTLSSPTFAPPTPNLSGESTDPSPASSVCIEQPSKRRWQPLVIDPVQRPNSSRE